MSCLQTCILHMHVCLCRKVEKPLERLSIIYINHTDNFMLRQLTSFKKIKAPEVILAMLEQHIIFGYRCIQLF